MEHKLTISTHSIAQRLALEEQLEQENHGRKPASTLSDSDFGTQFLSVVNPIVVVYLFCPLCSIGLASRDVCALAHSRASAACVDPQRLRFW